MKKNKIIFWTTTIFLFLFEGMMPLSTLIFAPSHSTAGTVYLQYPAYFAYVIITFKVLGAILLVIPGRTGSCRRTDVPPLLSSEAV